LKEKVCVHPEEEAAGDVKDSAQNQEEGVFVYGVLQVLFQFFYVFGYLEFHDISFLLAGWCSYFSFFTFSSL